MSKTTDNDDLSAFLEEMQDVSPLNTRPQAHTRKASGITPGQQARKSAAQ